MAIKFLNTVAVDTDVLYVDASSNRVGIGTPNPSKKLHVNSGSTNEVARFESTDGVAYLSIMDSNTTYSLQGIGSVGDELTFYNNNSEKVRIDSSGNVGIGTTNPTKKLDVNGSTNIDGTLFVNAINNHIRLIDSNGTGNFSVGVNTNFQIRDITANTTPLTIKAGTPGNTIVTTSSGNVGIGTGSPEEILHVQKTGADTRIQIISDTTRSSTIFFGDTDDDNAGVIEYDNNGDYMRFFANAAERVRIKSNGYVGIATTNPQSSLHVNGTDGITVAASDGAYSDGYFGRIQSDYGTNALRIVSRSGDVFRATNYGQDVAILTGTPAAGTSERIRITSSGNVGINKTAPAARFHVNGSTIITLPSTGNYFKIEGDVDNNLFYAKNDSIGIGTTSPSEKLEVAGNARITGDVTLSNGNALRWTSDDVRIEGTTAGDNIKFYVANTEILQLAQSGTLATVTGDLRVTGAYYDSNNLPGTSGQVLSSTATGTDWVSLSEISGVDGTGTTNYVAKWSDTDTITDSVIYDDGTNVGIGTTSPSAKLHIDVPTEDNQPAFKITKVSDSGENAMEVYHGTSSALRGIADFTNSLGSVMFLRGDGNVGIGTTSPGTNLDVVRSGNSYIQTRRTNASATTLKLGSETGVNVIVSRDGGTGNQPLAFLTGVSERMRITSTGNVGIGVSSSINGTLTLPNSGIISFHDANGDARNSLQFVSGDLKHGAAGAGLTSQSFFTNGAERMRIGSDGKVYFGNQNNVASSGYIDKQTSGNYEFKIYASTSTNTNRAITFHNRSNTEAMRIDTSGSVGIGTTSTSDKLHVIQGSDAFRGITIEGTTPALYLKDTQATNAYHIGANGNYLYFLEDSNQSGGYNNIMAFWDPSNNFIFSLGNVGIGTSNPNFKLQVNGSALAGGVVTYSKNYSSLNTTGNAVAGLTTSFNGASAGFTFTCFGHGGYQKVVYSCYNVSGTWNTIKVIDEGTNAFDVEASANATTITFTFKSTSGTKSYTPRVTVEATGSAINSTYA